MIEIADGEFREPRLAAVYDALDPEPSDLDQYEQIVHEQFGALSVLDIGCGTGVLALRLAARGLSVIGLDPAEASVDVATMTANVAQVFLGDEDFRETPGVALCCHQTVSAQLR